MGLINQFLERKVMMVVYYLQNIGAIEIKVLWLQRSPCIRSWVVFLPIHCLLIKRFLLPNLYCVYLMYIGLMNIFNCIINMLFI